MTALAHDVLVELEPEAPRCGSATPPARAERLDPVVCDERLGRYRLRYALATGGMATVYLAVAPEPSGLARAYAIKRIHPHLALQREYVEMFLDEARIASLLHHPNVCGVLDFGRAHEAAGGEVWWLAMEYLVGVPFARMIGAGARADRRTPGSATGMSRWPVFAARLVSEACEGLHTAHELRDGEGRSLHVVHRDVSPHNLFVGFDGRLKVVDFGIATAAHRIHHTATGMVKGKFAYMAPEQMRGHAVDRRADVWSLGVVLWEAVAGRPLFRAGNESETILRALGGKVPPLHTVAPVPEELSAVVARALKVDASERYPDALELGRALARFVASSPPPADAAEVAEWMGRQFPGEQARQRELVQRAFASADERDEPLRASWSLPASGSEGSPSVAAARSAVIRRTRSDRGHRRAIYAGAAMLSVACALAIGMIVGRTAAPPAHVAAPPPPPSAPPPRQAEPSRPSRSTELPPPSPPSVVVEPRPVASAAPAPVVRAARTDDDEEHGRGEVQIATSGGWADVYHRGRRLGPTPGRFVLPAGRQSLTLRPAGDGAPRRASVHVRRGVVVRLRVNLGPPSTHRPELATR